MAKTPGNGNHVSVRVQYGAVRKPMVQSVEYHYCRSTVQPLLPEVAEHKSS